jgi:hypothetical protein
VTGEVAGLARRPRPPGTRRGRLRQHVCLERRIAFSKPNETGALRSGDLVLLFGFGGGLAYAGQVVCCP